MSIKLWPMRARMIGAGALIAPAVLLGGCGSATKTDHPSPTPANVTATSTTPRPSGQPASARVTLSADPKGDLDFSRKQLSATAGSVTFVMNNPKTTGQEHGIAVEGNGVDKDGPTVGPAHTSTVTLQLKPGTYTFYCPVAGHRTAGMKGTLTVK